MFNAYGAYSALVSSCPLQTDTFPYSIIHSHLVKVSLNKFQWCYERVVRLILRMGYPHKVTFKAKRTIIKTRVFYTKTEYIYMRSYIISVAYICGAISCLKCSFGFPFCIFNKFPPRYSFHLCVENYKTK